MGNFAKYSRILINSLVSFVILLALAQLVIPTSWKLVLDYYLISNFLLLNPCNMMHIGAKEDVNVTADTMSRTKRTVEKTETPEEADATDQMLKRSKRRAAQENDTRDILLNSFLSFMKHCFLIIAAPVIFMQKLLINN
ncbi:hypothetical protein [Liquorilactobacillus mali]|uniref:Uncharacterized protein n=1 Tax=Liquorilactobacillus mali KCTC 3596 = DSM 20444 TaxID=1046596 RepID=J1F4T9_9LACO|nr:hypothetical protein [Liquorilactobacillus mali]EJF00939.1 hypothetical protein LMA_02164 [Liquorilactobacillus mali KCTC 3596 = DSM 20444]KRN11535.1 hypothetical protein FD00_GL000067 [Liquorilactobacillus mali KCTC 3596 = DSM 20444]QFQ74284.1 hypothetical protein LM596_03680 [Liquorilactobacillus mali]